MRVKSSRKQAMPTHPPTHRAGLRSRERGLCGANNTRPALSLFTDLTLPLQGCCAGVGFPDAVFVDGSGCTITRVLLKLCLSH